ncbi:hypothetical protein [Anaeromyxobacter paludicola]|uniref:CHAD domain-containing protein n=1 Tax=Anaeromyxobacter paludicola TaxID=2918171 RepID=A0ABN6N9W0_9BACT|nr:hypothetical protein [Anaeromyxobacter paludicola]BDG10028.1 hypothetical protein AMPC_31410 [Anaeromyxobacter paludicola]
MNENLGDLKVRLRKLSTWLESEDGRILQNLDCARAVSQAKRLLRSSARSREPSSTLKAAVERAELLGRTAGVR